ncbi:MAG: type III-B CRISPR module-associated protein Cmr5 [Bacteroidetes bacterium]|nr:type III-B CRISPR module-associated protein Cmr5 [Bacteroidota bacterium]MCW5897538.1 type III-B CRISPR module-associated protein Cmr5 [Bacteroidota bacterium]
MKTRAQRHLELASELVLKVAQKYPQEDNKVRKTYGSLCHSFPVMVRTCGLCQAVAFSKAKAAGDDSRIADAHRLLLEHLGELLHAVNSAISKDDVVSPIRSASATVYMLYTRQILTSWIYFKRFAESILKVQAGENEQP